MAGCIKVKTCIKYPFKTNQKEIEMDQTPQYAVGWFTLALFNANIAQIKWKSGLMTFIGSLVFGPVVTL